jgi:hypothetical protein
MFFRPDEAPASGRGFLLGWSSNCGAGLGCMMIGDTDFAPDLRCDNICSFFDQDMATDAEFPVVGS